MNARLQRRFADGFQFDFNYRFSKSLDTYSFEAPCGCTNQTFPVDQSTEYGPSDYDVRHYWTVSGLWDLPFYRNQREWTGKLLGGWQINGIVTRHSGFPWTPVLSSSVRGPNGNFFGPVRPISFFGGQPDDNTNDNFLRPGGIFPGGGSAFFSTSLNGNDFFSNPPGIGRNVFRGPKYFNVDMSVSKRFGLPGFGVLASRLTWIFVSTCSISSTSGTWRRSNHKATARVWTIPGSVNQRCLSGSYSRVPGAF